jgi:hypothetical protein
MKYLIIILFNFSLISCLGNDYKTVIYENKSYSTTDWHRFSPQEKNIKISLSIPINWELNSSVIDFNNNKIAEFLPGVVYKELGTLISIKQILETSSEANNKSITIRGNKLIITEEILADDGESPSVRIGHTYILEYKKGFFICIIFYNDKDNVIDQKVMDKIVNSIRIINPNSL